MSERILDESHAVAIKLVFNRLQDLRSAGHGAPYCGIDILDVNQHARRRIARRGRTVVPHLRNLIGQHDVRVANLQLRMPNAPPGPGMRTISFAPKTFV